LVRPQEQILVNPTYLEFFGLTQSPFARFANGSNLFASEQYSLLMEHLATATSTSDSLVVVCGADGSGKSTLLNRFVTSVDDHTYCVAIDEHCHGEKQFYNEFLKQIGFAEIEGTLNELKNITKEFLVCRGIARDHVLIIIDNAHLANSAVLEQLRWLCRVKVKDRRPLSVVLTGNANIIRVVDAHGILQTKFRNHIAFGIRSYSEEETADYIWHRLGLAGSTAGVKFAENANSAIHRYSGGIPRLINRLCDNMLSEAHNLESRVITENIVRAAAKRLQLLPHVAPFHGKGRRKSDPDFTHIRAVPEVEVVDTETLLQKVAELNEQLEDLRAEKAQATQDIDVRNEEIIALRQEFDSRTAEVESLTHSVASKSDEIIRKIQELTDKDIALQDSENRVKNLAADLKNQIQLREAAQRELAKATATIEELRQLKTELQTTVDDVHSDLKTGLKLADERAATITALEQSIVDLNKELDDKTVELDSLRYELALRNEAFEDVETQCKEAQARFELAQREIAVLKDPKELEEIERASNKLAADLEQEIRARKAAENELEESRATVEELTLLGNELQASVRDLNVDLGMAGEQAVHAHVLERNIADLKDELDSRNLAFAELEAQLEESRRMCEMLRLRAAAVDTRDDIVSKDTAKSSDLDSVDKFVHSISEIHAYQKLREHDPIVFDGLVHTYRTAAGQGLSDKQINDTLRAKHAVLMGRLLPRASDDAIISYANLIVDQLDEFQLDGIEPCLTLLVPPSDPEHDASPVYSEKSKERELETLDMILRTYNADRRLPTQADVWPDLEPKFAELFDAFGADNVAAMENSYDPSIDRVLVCNVSRALYSGVLSLPKRRAAKALRWLLSSD
jgi:type II secretory pathway predicted ATPase ExeA